LEVVYGSEDARLPTLRTVSSNMLGRSVEMGEHSSVEDARATMELFYCIVRGASRIATIVARLSVRMRPLLKSRLVEDGTGSRAMVMFTDEPMSTACDLSGGAFASSHFVALADRPSLARACLRRARYESAGGGQPCQRRCEI
jgi:hypothetical protein